MTVKELKEKLNEYPDNMEVFMAERKTEFAYGLLNSVKKSMVTFIEDPFDTETDEAPKVECVILDEE